ncbi:MAG TPA: Type 1 glutamine amidotransferase-like domain-containing protein, partial [Actinomycetales bacterium]
MSGDVCLQGGAELQPGCESMDTAMLLGPDGAPRRVLVAPFAGRAGREQEAAGGNARRWYTGLGAVDVTVSADEPGAFAEALRLLGDGLLVLPGGSPARLLEALAPHAVALREAVAGGLAVSGASAGAMVLCQHTVLPGGTPRVVPGLGLVPVDLVLPHYRGSRDWLEAARPSMP